MGLKNKKKIIAIILIVVIVIISGITYGYWNKEYIGKENTNNFNCLQIEVKENKEGITLNNAYPITDEEGINDSNNVYEVQIKNTCNLMVQYNVIANIINNSNLEESHVKVGSKKTTEEEYAINLLSNYEETTPTVEEVKKARVIKRGYLKKDETTKISVKEWMDYETTKEEGENKKFISKITIEGINGENTLGGKILANNKVIEKEPDFSKGEPPVSGSNTGSGLYKTEDDEGTSYYFRGAVENNYVKFANMLWRIVRINGDGTIRLILNENIGLSEFNTMENLNLSGYTYDNEYFCVKENSCNKNIGTSSIIKTYLEKWYENNLVNYDDKIATSYFCNDTSYNHYDNDNYIFGSHFRILKKKPTLKCPKPIEEDGSLKNNGGVYKLKVGLITADELMYAGIPYYNEDGIGYASQDNFLYLKYGWTLSPALRSVSDLRIFILNPGRLDGKPSNSADWINPVINLSENIKIIGNGTKNNPYVVQ